MLIQQPQDWTGVDKLQAIFLLLILHMGCTTRNILIGYLLQLLITGYLGPFIFFLKCVQFLPGTLKDQETVDHRFS